MVVAATLRVATGCAGGRFAALAPLRVESAPARHRRRRRRRSAAVGECGGLAGGGTRRVRRPCSDTPETMLGACRVPSDGRTDRAAQRGGFAARLRVGVRPWRPRRALGALARKSSVGPTGANFIFCRIRGRRGALALLNVRRAALCAPTAADGGGDRHRLTHSRRAGPGAGGVEGMGSLKDC